jgi:C4-dicarboxylate-specific signal transduction histidine kinase
LQQVLMNLMTKGIDAMKDVYGPRDFIICAQRAGVEQLVGSVSNSGVGLSLHREAQILNGVSFHPILPTRAEAWE